MSKQSRRNFLATTGKAAVVTGLATFAGKTVSAMPTVSGPFIHHVYFWLKNPTSTSDKAKLVEGLKKLSKVKTIKNFYIGQPAATNRDVIDRSYAISWLCFFENAADQDSYQTDPIHLDFVKDYSSLWTKVIVYDSVEV